MADDLFNIDELLNDALKSDGLQELFDKKLEELKLNKTNVSEILNIQSRTLTGILTGTQKLVDVTNLIKIADFIQRPKEEVFKLYIDLVQKKHSPLNISPKKIKFIKENFDLAVLKKAGLINSITDFDHIEKRINSRLGFKTIFEYKKPSIDVAFSSGLFKPKNLLTRLFWIRAAISTFEEIDNTNEYNRDELVKFFPSICLFSMNVERGLTEVIKTLFKIGITVIYQPPLQGLQLRGATFSVNDKPCIVITNYRGFYSTLWFCLLHELYHVLFDWAEIKNNCYHLTDDDNEELSVQERESEADNFASEFLFSKEKLRQIRPLLQDSDYVKSLAMDNHVHESIIYASNAFDKKNDAKAWARTKKYSPPVASAIRKIEYAWSEERPFEEMITEHKSIINT